MNGPIALNLNEAETAMLERACQALHGVDDWKRPSARDLGINIRNFRRMADGETPIPPGIWINLRALLIRHSLACRDIAVELPKGESKCAGL